MIDKLKVLRQYAFNLGCIGGDSCPHCIASVALKDAWECIEKACELKYTSFMYIGTKEAELIINKAISKIEEDMR